jgi:hypothetical protein
MLKIVYGQSAMKQRTVYRWVDRFKEGRERVDDNTREGRPSTSRVGENVQRVHDLMMSDSLITTRIITDKLGISEGSVQTNLKEDLNMRTLCAKNRSEIFDSGAKTTTCCLLPRLDGDEEGSNFLQRVITGDESQIYEYDTETKRQKSGSMVVCLATKKHKSFKNEDHAPFFFNVRGVVHHEFVPQGQTVSDAFYVKVLKRLHKRVRHVRPELLAEKN